MYFPRATFASEAAGDAGELARRCEPAAATIQKSPIPKTYFMNDLRE
jgi:hypothetical protein